MAELTADWAKFKCLGGPGNMLAFGDRDEDTKLLECHGRIITGRLP
jgi:hypothetical protein